MHKAGITKSSEEFHQESSGIERDIRGLHERTLSSAITGALRRRQKVEHEVKLPTKEELQQSIDSLFRFSDEAQPSNKLNAAAGIADSASLYLILHQPTAIAGAIGLAASESISVAKNYANTRHYSKLGKSESRFLKDSKSKLISALELKRSHAGSVQEKEIKNLMKETNELFSEIERRSKEGLNTALGSRLEAFASSGAAFIINNFPYSPIKALIDGTSDYFTSLARVQPIQFPPYNPPLAIIDIAVRAGWLVGMSSFIELLVYEYKKYRSEIHQLVSRDDVKEDLMSRAGLLLDQIQEELNK